MLKSSPSQNQIKDLLSLYNKNSFHQLILKTSDLLNLFPNSFLLYNILGAAYSGVKEFNLAIKCYRKSITINSNFADGYNNLGIVYKEKGDLKSAIQNFNKALKIKPNYAEALNNIGVVYKDSEDLDLALKNFKEALEIKPNYPDAYNNIGNVLKDKGFLDEAIKNYNQAININPNFTEAYNNKCEVLEKLNKINDLEKVIIAFKNKVNQNNFDLFYYEALLKYRQKNYRLCLKIFEEYKLSYFSEKLKASILFLKGNCNHKMKKFSKAFENFSDMNKTVKNSDKYRKLNVKLYFNRIKERQNDLIKLKNSTFKKIHYPKLDKQPIFLIGFPRSGTTLLDTVLRTHSEIEVVEEQWMVSNIEQKLTKSLNTNQIENLAERFLNKARNLYFSELSKHTNIKNNSRTIDKFPLNILNIPLINKVFPEGKYILALRHPLDCILSNFMQNFKLNVAMANMLEIDQIVKFYCLSMHIFELCHKRYNLDVHKIKYEDLINDFENEVYSLLKFLNLDWEQALVNFHLTAKKRKVINTPSYSQVIQPIYKDSTYKWKSYSNQLEKYFQNVEYWVEKFGYESLK